MRNRTLYNLTELKAIMGRKTMRHGYLHIQPGKVLRSWLEVANDSTSKVVYEVEFTRENGEKLVEDITCVL